MRVTLIAAQSLDGFITRHDEPGTAFTSPADQAYFARVLAGFDCSVCGSRTYSTLRDALRSSGRLAQRRRIVLTREPERYAADAVAGALEFSREEPRALCRRLAGAGHRACALLGGGEVHRSFFADGCVDRVWLTLEPRLFGRGTPLVRGELDVALSLESVERLAGSDSLLAKYLVRK